MTIKELYSEGMKTLEKAGILEADIDARYLLLECLNMSTSMYYLRMNDKVDNNDVQKYRNLIEKRSTHYPLQYIIGKQEFMGLDFFVDENVLIPRQDTEVLVEKVLERIDELFLKKHYKEISILDMCTGSGCIAISLSKIAKERYPNKKINVDAIDISKKALNITRKNVLINNVEVNVIESDLFDNVVGRYDIIVSNPPYIKSEDIDTLMSDVKDFEPRLALDGDKDGLFFYRKIIKEARNYLNANAGIFFEIGCDQGEEVFNLLEMNGYNNCEILKDLAKLDRVVTGYRCIN